MKRCLIPCFSFLLLIVTVPSSYGQDGAFGFSSQWGTPGSQWGTPGNDLGGFVPGPGTHDLPGLHSLRQSDFDPMVRNSLTAFDKFFNSFLDEAKRPATEDLMSRFRISEEDGEVIVEVQVAPGTDFEHITVTPKGDLLSINVQKEGSQETGGPFTTRIEWHRESFTRTGPIPEGTQAGGMTTDYKNELLKMVFPRSD